MKRNFPTTKMRPISEMKADNALYRLLVNFLASEPLAHLIANEDFDDWVFNQMVDEHEENEIIECLIYSATSLRAADDLSQTKKKYMQENVGHYADEQQSSLSLREACNKIIHAQEIKYNTDKFEDIEYLNTNIFLSGIYKRKKWQVNIDIRKYVENAHRALQL